MPTKKSSKGSSKKSAKKPSKKSGAKGGKALSATDLGVSSLGENTLVASHDKDILAHVTGACHRIIGNPFNLEVCYSYDGSTNTACVTVKLLGQTLGRDCLSASDRSYRVCGQIGTVKVCITVSFNPSTKCLTYKADACVKIFGWSCKSYSGRIVCF